MTKRFNIITAIVVCVLLAAFGLAIAWICINKDVLVSGSKIYTQEQYEEYGEKRYQDGLEQNKTAEELMKKYKSELENEQTAHLKTKAELQKEKEKTNQDQARIAELEARLAAQEETLTRLSGLIESYEEIKNGTYELSFKVDGKLYKTIAVVKNGNVKNLPNDPQKEGYAFEGWVEEGTETLVDFTTYTATKDTTFTAKFTKTYEVKFVSNDVEIKTSMVKENGFAEAPATPEGDFVGWTLNGTDVVDIATTPITANTTFIARFKKWINWSLDNEFSDTPVEGTAVAYKHYRDISSLGDDFKLVLKASFSSREQKDTTQGMGTVDKTYSYNSEGKWDENNASEIVLTKDSSFTFTGIYKGSASCKIELSLEIDEESKEFKVNYKITYEQVKASFVTLTEYLSTNFTFVRLEVYR